ncbi:ergothioneine biosynthesis PLP-dependent enzyme EgtE [Streptomyces hawaiiensis]|uniref:aminotransferase class V-fold PLP-dependent enzyme n=1 Tax=Streptomyces hawaiiensis TaxID=67305 RepID=UPI0031D0E2BD
MTHTHSVIEPSTVWPDEELGRKWREARSCSPAGYLNAAACNVASDSVVTAMIRHLHDERALGGYEAATRAEDVLEAGRAALAAYVDATGADVAFMESGTAAMASLLAGWGLTAGARVAVVRSEFGSNRMLLHRLAEQRDWTLVELPVDSHSRLQLDGLVAALSQGLDMVMFPHIASHRGVVQPAQDAGRLCRAAGVPLVLDVCQALGHVDLTGIGAAAYVGTSRKWLAGPRGAGFVIVPGLAEQSTPDAFAPTFQTHGWGRSGGLPAPGARRYEQEESAIACRVGLAVAAQEHRELGPARIFRRLASIGQASRHILDGAGGWRVNEPLDEPTAIVTLRPPPGDMMTTVDQAASAIRAAGIQAGILTPLRAPEDMAGPVLRVAPSVGAYREDVVTVGRVLAGAPPAP